MPPHGFAQSLTAISLMPDPGTMVGLTQVYTPTYLKGMKIDANDPFKFDFMIYRGDENLTADQKQAEYPKLVKYFLAALAIPDTDQWVNLSPYEEERIVPDNFGLTEMGRDFLAQDYLLKQISSSLTHPDTDLGKKFWDEVYARAYDKFGTTEIPTDTFNKVWVTPDKAVIYEKDGAVMVLEQHLKVMLDKDYLATRMNNTGGQVAEENDAALISQQVMREVIIPAIEKEVNEGRSFAPVRQVYSGMLLATWYKMALKESILGKLYADQSKVKGVDQDPRTNQEIYTKYVEAFKKGVFNMIKEDVDRYSQEIIPRKYFSGGFNNKYIGVISKASYENARKALEIVKNVRSGESTLALDFDRAAIQLKNVQDVQSAQIKGASPFNQTAFITKVQDQGYGSNVKVSQSAIGMYRITGLNYGLTVKDILNDKNGLLELFLGLDDAVKLLGVEDNRREGGEGYVDVYLGPSNQFVINALRAEDWDVRMEDGKIVFTAFTGSFSHLAGQTDEDAVKEHIASRVGVQSSQITLNIEPGTGGKNTVKFTVDRSQKRSIAGRVLAVMLPVVLSLTGCKYSAQDTNMNRTVPDSFVKDTAKVIGTGGIEVTTATLDGASKVGGAKADVGRMQVEMGMDELKNVLQEKGVDRGVIDQLGAFDAENFKSTKPAMTFYSVIEVSSDKSWVTVEFMENGVMIQYKFDKNGRVDKASLNENGGIDMNAAHMDLQIKRDGNGVPLPVSQQNLENIRIDGLVPVLLDIKPVTGMALFN